MNDYHDRIEAVRDEMDRAADIARGLGHMLGPDDLRYFGRRMDEAALPTLEEYTESLKPTPEEQAEFDAIDREMWEVECRYVAELLGSLIEPNGHTLDLIDVDPEMGEEWTALNLRCRIKGLTILLYGEDHPVAVAIAAEEQAEHERQMERIRHT